MTSIPPLVPIAAGLLLLGLSLPAGSPAADSASSTEKPGWTLTFHDEFDGPRLDGTKWDDHYWSGRTHSNNELEYRFPLQPRGLVACLIPVPRHWPCSSSDSTEPGPTGLPKAGNSE
jgi:hypothetical protein